MTRAVEVLRPPRHDDIVLGQVCLPIFQSLEIEDRREVPNGRVVGHLLLDVLIILGVVWEIEIGLIIQVAQVISQRLL